MADCAQPAMILPEISRLTLPAKDPFFIPFGPPTDTSCLPDRFMYQLDQEPHPLCLAAAGELQEYLSTQEEWQHNFGLSAGKEGTVIGKMFGVLVVKTQQNEVGYLAAFSGKLAGGNHHTKFVPPVFDGLTDNSFVNNGMSELKDITREIKKLEEGKPEGYEAQARLLKTARRNYSVSLQNKIFDEYHFLNQAGEEKSLLEIFQAASYKNPPAGAGECAAPKLLQYAFQHHLQPVALAEFWWGLSPKSAFWQHGHFYPCCREKCGPILAHMLVGMAVPPPVQD